MLILLLLLLLLLLLVVVVLKRSIRWNYDDVLLIRNYDKLIDREAIDQFFAVTKAKKE